MTKKIKDFMSPPIPDDECTLCEIHKRAYKYFVEKNPFFECPACDHPIPYIHGIGCYQIIGETGAGDPEEKLYLAPVDRCPSCHAFYTLLPKQIKYNGNHDIYYLDEKRCIPSIVKRFIGKVRSIIQ